MELTSKKHMSLMYDVCCRDFVVFEHIECHLTSYLDAAGLDDVDLDAAGMCGECHCQ